ASNHASGYDFRLFYLAGAASGSNTLAVTYSDGNMKPKMLAGAWSGVDQTTPVSGLTNGTGSTSTPSWMVTSATGELVAQFGGQIGATSASPGSPAVERIDQQFGTTGFYGWLWEEDGAASVTINGTLSGVAEWFGTAFSIKAASAGLVVNPLTGIGGSAARPLAG